ncbi:MAG: retron St85 family RNA-directed DNA polymerase [Pseudomonadota bacterium]
MTDFISHLSKKTGVPKARLIQFISTAHHRYKVFFIEKRQGGKRKIAQPSRGLKTVQRHAIQMLGLKSLHHPSAMAYVSGVSIKENADRHCRNAYMLKMDFKNFFPSIKPQDFLDRLELIKDFELGSISRAEKILIARLFFFLPARGDELELSIGAPSSPDISNFVMREFDEELSNFCSLLGVTYTRYADDLVFSCSEKGVLHQVQNYIHERCNENQSPNLTVNTDKTVNTSKKHNRHVTGLTITNDAKLSLGRERKRNLSSAVHHYSLSKLSDNRAAVIAGWLRFALHVEPSFVTRLREKYSDDVVENLLQENSGKRTFKR